MQTRDIAEALMRNSPPELVATLAYVCKQYRQVNLQHAGVWQSLMSKHFPNHLPKREERYGTNWRELFIRSYQSTYYLSIRLPEPEEETTPFPLALATRKKFSLIKDGLTTDIQAGITLDDANRSSDVDTQQLTMLDWIIRKKHQPVLNHLFEKAREKNCQQDELVAAAITFHQPISTLAELHRQGLMTNTKLPRNQHVLILAARACNYAATQWLLEQKIIEIDAKDDLGYSALTAAAEKGHTEMVSLLLKNGADINQVCRLTLGTCTALSLAIRYGHTDTAQFLIDHQAKPLFINPGIAGWQGHIETVKMALKNRDNLSLSNDYLLGLLDRSIEIGHLEMMKLLFNAIDYKHIKAFYRKHIRHFINKQEDQITTINASIYIMNTRLFSPTAKHRHNIEVARIFLRVIDATSPNEVSSLISENVNKIMNSELANCYGLLQLIDEKQQNATPAPTSL